MHREGSWEEGSWEDGSAPAKIISRERAQHDPGWQGGLRGCSGVHSLHPSPFSCTQLTLHPRTLLPPSLLPTLTLALLFVTWHTLSFPTQGTGPAHSATSRKFLPQSPTSPSAHALSRSKFMSGAPGHRRQVILPAPPHSHLIGRDPGRESIGLAPG